ncbi:MAG: 4-hydroxythreonine-4-phosphate dehydrogenase PdxA [Spirochaetes bacterium]|nr:4-hydroxythreonine-4-phosphate dehydrogenase PdxA [Spirochaetota bacterium]HNV44600.1 4-hydroxythreonine-4-phosphate dehydrogenase PdxA [Exilispira sp.]HPB46998.1 4-hydroxythreonine-4-phosphate dehydrogenase PdxA [Exilispira sp.]
MNSYPIIFSFGDPGSINGEIFLKSQDLLCEKFYIIVGSQKSLTQAEDLTGIKLQSKPLSLFDDKEVSQIHDSILLNIKIPGSSLDKDHLIESKDILIKLRRSRLYSKYIFSIARFTIDKSVKFLENLTDLEESKKLNFSKDKSSEFNSRKSSTIKKGSKLNFADKKGKDIFYSRLDYQKITDSIIIDPLPELNIESAQISFINGFLSLLYLDISLCIINLLKNRASLITLPVNKKSVSLIERCFLGHTEYISNWFNTKDFRMMMYEDDLHIMLETIHIPIKKLSKHLCENHFIKTLEIASEYIKILNFAPYIALLGLNPHCSDGSLIGNDEQSWIRKAIKEFESRNFHDDYGNRIKIVGPISADAAFVDYKSRIYYCGIYIAWYHDQGLIPFKIISKTQGVNITCGLPFLRVSPDHGTAFDITFKNIAKPDSLKNCIEICLKWPFSN